MHHNHIGDFIKFIKHCPSRLHRNGFVLFVWISFVCQCHVNRLTQFPDPCTLPQGVDYCLFSLAIADLLAGLLIGPLSVVSLEFNSWIFGDALCKTLGFAMFALWAVNVNSLFWLSVDRLLYITDYKYCTYKMRTRARCKEREK